MLIRFKAENWKSFPSLEFSAIAGKERRHGERVACIDRPKMRLLPISAIYGGNASGKSNFFKALEFARRFVVDGVRPHQGIGVKPFALNAELSAQPTSFEFEILARGKVYRYSFSATRNEVLSERLVEIRQTIESPIFRREGEKISFGSKWENDSLIYAGSGTQNNLLFLTNSIFQKREDFRPVYDWFLNTLLLISPNASCSRYEMYANSRSPFQPQNQEALDEFDVGIERIDSIEIPENQVPFQVNVQIQNESDFLPDGAVFQIGPYLIRKKGETQKVEKMFAVHSLEGGGGKKTLFELTDESDGTCRLLDLIPAFSFLRDKTQNRVVFVDEIDRSLHHLLTRKLIEDYLDGCNASTRSQLFFTTHDALLMDQDLLRRDELWLVDKNDDRSSLLSVDDFRIRHDKSLLNAYLYGRFGGTPKLRRR